MQVQRVNSGVTGINHNSVNFRSCKGIICSGDFKPKEIGKHAIAINEFINSPEFKAFGEKYNFIAHFDATLSSSLLYKFYYLHLEPVSDELKNTEKALAKAETSRQGIDKQIADASETQLTNLPIKFTPCRISDSYEPAAYKNFMKQIKNMEASYLFHILDSTHKMNNEKLTEEQNIQSEAEAALENIENSGIPIIY